MASLFLYVLQHCSKWSSDANIVFSSWGKKWVVVFQKLKDTMTNEKNIKVKDSRYAKFSADRLKVICVFNKFNVFKMLKQIDLEMYTCLSDRAVETCNVNDIILTSDHHFDTNYTCNIDVGNLKKNMFISLVYIFIILLNPHFLVV
jgi:hypothetical protein